LSKPQYIVVEILCSADLLVFGRFSSSSEAKEGLKCGCGGSAAIVPEDEFVEVDLELRLAHSVIGSDQPFLEVSNGAIGKWDRRLRAFTKFGSQRLSAGDMFEPGFRETLKALQAVRVDGRAGSDVLGEEGYDGLGFEIWDPLHSDAPRAPATLFHRDQNQRRSSTFKLPTSAETGLLAANPRFIHFDLAVQRLPSYIHHGPAEFV